MSWIPHDFHRSQEYKIFFFTSDQVKGLSKGQYRDFKELSLDLKAVMTRFSLPPTLRKESG